MLTWEQKLLKVTEDIDVHLEYYLTKQQYQILKLHVEDNLKYTEIAKIVGLSPQRIKQIDNKAMWRLETLRPRIICEDLNKEIKELRKEKQELIDQLRLQCSELKNISEYLKGLPLDKAKLLKEAINDRIPIEELNLSNRVLNALKHYKQIKFINELLQYTEDDLMRIRNLGYKSILELEEKLKELGYHLKPAFYDPFEDYEGEDEEYECL